MAAKTNLVVDTFLNTLIASSKASDYNTSWDVLSDMIPGSTPLQLKSRHDELQAAQPNRYLLSTSTGNISSLSSSFSGNEHSTKTISYGTSRLQPTVGQKLEESKSPRMNLGNQAAMSILDDSHDDGDQHEVIIQVRDDPKKVKKDFSCPKNLLVREMRYFADYLTPDKNDEYDISVQCDVEIFEWLMRYVKRNISDPSEEPLLDVKNVISILISSDFLKMDGLVEICIQFCHDNINGILTNPVNMNCINDTLLKRLARLFTNRELEEIRDKKDKLRSKLFFRKVEFLFDPDEINKDSLHSASTVFRCKHCLQILTDSTQKLLSCTKQRVAIDRGGNLVYFHLADPSFDVTEWLISILGDGDWRRTYWQVWGAVNGLFCTRCQKYFRCIDFGRCHFHPARDDSTVEYSSRPQGNLMCCQGTYRTFDPLEWISGCQARDHVVDVSQADPKTLHVYEAVVNHRDAICSESPDAIWLTKRSSLSAILAVFENESMIINPSREPKIIEKNKRKPKEKPEWPSTDNVDYSQYPEEALTDLFRGTKFGHWDASKTVRFNQDAQREIEHKRFFEIRRCFHQLKEKNGPAHRPKPKEMTGGLFCVLENHWKTSITPKSWQSASGTPAVKARTKSVKLGGTSS